MNDIAKNDSMMYSIIVNGDVSKLSGEQQAEYYTRTCESLGLNPLTKPFDYITLNGKRVLYAKKDATEQLRKINGVSVLNMDSKQIGDVWITQVSVSDRSGRVDMATGAVSIKGLAGDALANAVMKAETKAKRRATLSVCGLGVLDETELETIPEIKNITQNQPKSNAPAIPENTGTEQPKPESTVSEKEEPPQSGNNPVPEGAHVMKEGDVIGAWFWKIPKELRNSYIPEGCKFEKVDGLWKIIKAA